MQRSYKQNCALALALDQVGERWTLLIIRELMIAPRRYKGLLENLAGIGTNLLAERLRHLEQQGIIEKSDFHYTLTRPGRRLEDVIHALVRFGLALEAEDDPDRLTRAEWDVVALRALYRPDCGSQLDGRYAIELNDCPFRIEKLGRETRVEMGTTDNPRVRVDLSKGVARRLARGEVTYRDAIQCGDLRVRGLEQEARILLRSFRILP